MSIRLPFTACEKTTETPPARRKLPSCTLRTRSFVGSKTSVSVTVEIRDASLISSGTVYGPPPTRNVVPGGEINTCAEPIPADVVGTAGGVDGAGSTAGGVGTGAAGGCGSTVAGGVTGGVETGGVGGGPYTVPLLISDASRISTVTLTLIFDPTKLRVTSVQEGSFLRAGGVPVVFTQSVNGNRIDITLSRSADATGASGTGVLAAILFNAIAPGSVTMTLSGTATGPGGAGMGLRFTPVTVQVQ